MIFIDTQILQRNLELLGGWKWIIYVINITQNPVHTKHPSNDMCVHSVVSDSLWPQRLQSARFFCPWDFPGKNIGVVAISFSMTSSQPRNPTFTACTGRQVLYYWATWEAPAMTTYRLLLLSDGPALWFDPWGNGDPEKGITLSKSCSLAVQARLEFIFRHSRFRVLSSLLSLFCKVESSSTEKCARGLGCPHPSQGHFQQLSWSIFKLAIPKHHSLGSLQIAEIHFS